MDFVNRGKTKKLKERGNKEKMYQTKKVSKKKLWLKK